MPDAFDQTRWDAESRQGLSTNGNTAMVKLAVPPRIGTPRHEERDSLGPFVQHVGSMMGLQFHEWQTHLSDVGCELVPRETKHEGQSALKFACIDVGALVGRQSGKSAWCVARIAAQCLLPSYPNVAEMVGLPAFVPQHAAYTAQARMNAVDKWREHVAIMESCPAINEQIWNTIRSNGHECVHFKNGSTYKPITPNRQGARGFTLDLCIVDEALTHPGWLLAVLRPMLAQRNSATGCIGAQFVVISNAGDEDSEMLNRLQDLGIESVQRGDGKRVWLEWSITAEDDVFDESVWARTMPTLNQPNGIEIEFLRGEAETLQEDQFAREYLCRRSVATRNQIISTELWQELYRDDVHCSGDLTLGLDVRMDRMGASLVACGPVDHYLPIEIVECRQGLEWILERTIEVARRWNAVVVLDAGGPAANLIPSLDRGDVSIELLQSPQVTAAAASFYDACMTKRITHLNDHRLNDAVAGASRRAVGDRWAFDRKGFADISPLVAASLATWVADNGQYQRPMVW